MTPLSETKSPQQKITPFLRRLFKPDLAVFTAYAVIVLGCYLNVLDGAFFFDDELLILQNKHVTDFQLLEIYTSPITAGAGQSGNFFRPHQLLVFSVLYQAFGANPVIFHLSNVLFHLSAGFLLFILLQKLRFERMPAFLGGLLFLIHPVQTDAVSYIAGSADAMGAVFLFSGLIQAVKAVDDASSNKHYLHLGAACLLYISGLLCKESIVAFFPIVTTVLLYHFSGKRFFVKKVIITLAATAVITGLYLTLKFSLLQFTPQAGLSSKVDPYTQSLALRLTTFVNIQWEYLKLIFFPLDLFWSKPYAAFSSLLTFRALPGNLLIIGFGFSFFMRRKMPCLFLSLAWFYSALTPFSGVIPLNAIYLEHWLYVPLGGIAIAVACGLSKIPVSKQTTAALAAALVLSLIFVPIIISRNKDWSNPEQFYLNEINHAAGPMCYNNLGKVYFKRQEYAKAEQYFLQTVKRFQPWDVPHHNLGSLYTVTGHLSRAEAHYLKALQLNPNRAATNAALEKLRVKIKETQARQQTEPIP